MVSRDRTLQFETASSGPADCKGLLLIASFVCLVRVQRSGEEEVGNGDMMALRDPVSFSVGKGEGGGGGQLAILLLLCLGVA